jgi:hypothetical protein
MSKVGISSAFHVGPQEKYKGGITAQHNRGVGCILLLVYLTFLHITTHCSMILNVELGRISKEVVVAKFKALPWNLSSGYYFI